MNTSILPVGTAVRFAPCARYTRLPFGGSVLINQVSLALAECGERDTDIIERLLKHGVPGPDAGIAVRQLVEQMVESGWFVPVVVSDRGR
jgi:hypothetical protein